MLLEDELNQVRALAELEGKDPELAARKANAGEKRWDNSTFMTGRVRTWGQGTSGIEARLAYDHVMKGAEPVVWCLWCEQIPTNLDQHMADHSASGFTPSIPLNRLLRWLGKEAIPGLDHLMIQITGRTGALGEAYKK